MSLRTLLPALLTLLVALPAAPAPAQTPAAPPVPAYWRTRAERTAYRQTADYDETVRFCKQLEASSGLVKVLTYGVSGQGRPLPMVVLSKDRAFTPERALATGKPIVLIQNGIHSGEIEGKDASLELMRDMVITRRHQTLLDSAIVLVLPIFSVDSHERKGRYNRINQNGPEEMGWRSTPIGLNLNRDYLKVEAPEMRALLTQVFTRWWPHLLVDNHTTNGADYRFDLTYSFSHGPTVAPPVERWLIDAFEGRVMARASALGHLTAPYLEFERNDPRLGFKFGASIPRFSTGYAPLHGRPAILVETHMLKPYATRVRATYDLMVALLEELRDRPRELTGAVAAAEAHAIARGREPNPAARRLALASDAIDSVTAFAFKGVDMRYEPSNITGRPVIRFGTTSWDTIVPLYRTLRPTLEVTQPRGYLIPQEWSAAIDRLAIHGVRFRRLTRAWRDTVEAQRIAQWSAAAASSEGHHPISVARVELIRRLRSYRPGDVWVPLDQRSAPIAVHMFEAQAPDGLMRWNFFDTVLERKEYAEAYVMEPIARQMMDRDPALASEFRARIAADTAFANSPEQRLDFFYRRSPWFDPEFEIHPVARALRPPPETVLAP